MRRRYILVAIVLVALGFSVGRLSAALGTVDSPDVPGNTWSFTLNDIYNRLLTGAAGAPSTFTEPAAGPGTGTGHTLDQVMGVAPVVDDTNGATQANVLINKTYWSRRTASWGHQAGTMPDREGDNASTAQAESGGVNYFTAPDGYYDGDDTVTATDAEVRALDTDIVSGNIRSTVSIFGVAGDPMVVNTSSGTAMASDILSDTVAYVDGLQITGTMTNNVAVTIVPTTTNQAIVAGYHNGFGEVLGDTDLVSGNIRSTVSIFGVDGDPNVVDTSSGNATPGDIASGKKAWVDGVEWTGTGTIATNPAPVPKTGQTTSYATGDDGDLEKGVSWPTPRFTDNGDGTVTDNLTGLMWMQDADAGTDCDGADTGAETWANALNSAAACNAGAGFAGYTDWRLPNVRELQSLIHYGFYDPAVPNTAGTGQWSAGNPFNNVQSGRYWSSTTCAGAAYTSYAYRVSMKVGTANAFRKTLVYYVWPVRGGQ